MRIKLSFKDKSLAKDKEVKKWVRKCEKIINKNIESIYDDYLTFASINLK